MTIDAAGLDLLFKEARSHNKWQDKPVSDETLHDLYDVLKFGPTSANSSPARFVFVRTKEGKAKLAEALSAGNMEKTMAAPVTAIVAYDPKFFEKLPTLFPHNPDAISWFTSNDSLAATTAFRNGTLQGAYLMIAARSLGLDTGAMSGFDNSKVALSLSDRPIAPSGLSAPWRSRPDPGLTGEAPPMTLANNQFGLDPSTCRCRVRTARARDQSRVRPRPRDSDRPAGSPPIPGQGYCGLASFRHFAS